MRNFDFKRYTPRPKKLLRASLKLHVCVFVCVCVRGGGGGGELGDGGGNSQEFVHFQHVVQSLLLNSTTSLMASTSACQMANQSCTGSLNKELFCLSGWHISKQKECL